MGRLSLRDVRKTYGQTEVIRGVDLDVADGEFLVFVGPSGCGKSTMLRMIAGLEEISAGDLLINDQRANGVHPSQRGAAMVFQSYALYPHMTVAENMGFSLRMAGVSAREREEQVRRIADTLRMSDLLGRYPRELSGGQRQRVAIGRAIVRKPEVFLFDEPLSNLDAALRVDMRIELSRLHKELGTTMIYVTHDQVEAMTMGDRIAVFNRGRIEQVGAPMALYEAPANTFVASFLGAPRINLIERPGSAGPSGHQALWNALGGASVSASVQRLGIRPEHMGLASAGQGVPATVVLAEHLGDVSVLYLRVHGLEPLVHAKIPSGSVRHAPGDAVELSVPSALALAFDAQGDRIAR